MPQIGIAGPRTARLGCAGSAVAGGRLRCRHAGGEPAATDARRTDARSRARVRRTRRARPRRRAMPTAAA